MTLLFIHYSCDVCDVKSTAPAILNVGAAWVVLKENEELPAEDRVWKTQEDAESWAKYNRWTTARILPVRLDVGAYTWKEAEAKAIEGLMYSEIKYMIYDTEGYTIGVRNVRIIHPE